MELANSTVLKLTVLSEIDVLYGLHLFGLESTCPFKNDKFFQGLSQIITIYSLSVTEYEWTMEDRKSVV